jgi:hypothetical protein
MANWVLAQGGARTLQLVALAQFSLFTAWIFNELVCLQLIWVILVMQASKYENDRIAALGSPTTDFRNRHAERTRPVFLANNTYLRMSGKFLSCYCCKRRRHAHCGHVG